MPVYPGAIRTAWSAAGPSGRLFGRGKLDSSTGPKRPPRAHIGPRIAILSAMPRIHTKCFGKVDYPPAAVFDFPNGLPGFEDEHGFVFLERPGTHPLLFMQSIATPELCFILMPVLAADPPYKLRLTEEDLAALWLPEGRQPRMGQDILCAALVCAGGEDRPDPTVNLLSPVVVNLKRQIGIQVIQTQVKYSYRHPLLSHQDHQELVPCS